MPKLTPEDQRTRDKEEAMDAKYSAEAEVLCKQLTPEMFVDWRLFKTIATNNKAATVLQSSFVIGEESEYFQRVKELYMKYDRASLFFTTKARMRSDEDGLYSLVAHERYITIDIAEYLETKGIRLTRCKDEEHWQHWKVSLIDVDAEAKEKAKATERAKEIYGQVTPEMFVDYEMMQSLVKDGKPTIMLQVFFQMREDNELYKELSELQKKCPTVDKIFKGKARVLGSKNGLHSITATEEYITTEVAGFLRTKGINTEFVSKEGQFDRWILAEAETKEKQNV